MFLSYERSLQPDLVGAGIIVPIAGLVGTHVLIDTPEQVFAEYMAHPTVAATGRSVHHLFAGRLVAGNGQIKLLRESLNPFAVAQALLSGGVKDLPDPEKVIFSVPPDYRS